MNTHAGTERDLADARRGELEGLTPAHLRAIAIRAGRPIATPRTADERRAAIALILAQEGLTQ